MEEVLNYFDIRIQDIIKKNMMENYLEEIRIRTNNPIILKFGHAEKVLNYTIKTHEVLELLQKICENSIYSYQEEICNGYITIKGGHRIGIAGNVVFKDNKVLNIKYISSLNFRIARQIHNCSSDIIKKIIDTKNNSIYNTLIVSSPGAGKTTILKDIIKKLSNGDIAEIKPLTIGVVDERGEIAGLYKGVFQNDIGIRTDVLDSVSKATGINMLVRSMAPQVVVADEIGTKEDISAINYAVCSGIKGIFTAHGGNLNDLVVNDWLKKLIDMKIIERIVILNEKQKGCIKEIFMLDKVLENYVKLE